jgi:predicted NUDIX family NTP pyrophosphohydrolase
VLDAELGRQLPQPRFAHRGKPVTAFAVAGDFDPAEIQSNSFEIEWPPKSGRRASFPEVDKAGWVTLAGARAKILAGQRPFIDRLEKLLDK